MQCAQPGCTNAPSHEYGFPGRPLEYICEEHRGGRDGLNIVDPATTSALVAFFKPIGGEKTEPSASVMCTHKSHNPAHVEQAVLAYEFPHGANAGETESVVEGDAPNTPRDAGNAIEPGVACPACIVEIVNMSQQTGWPVKLAVL